ncbi:hypothetical protein BBD42_06885 [Paenibacillus sp. BIHB 4019]|uniref:Exosporium protein C n=1 Tax=Paenibacillus sp. BIHB 4019 TaxID=1870819 RepID=A0A1B2DEV9_9BACL|nr:hypothetical protein [Paenibacillus sp. BIHB 4019]ANY66219.1 hypothetical protein BBD42_06885 [Paenibacillus sp. BIHB 4019]
MAVTIVDYQFQEVAVGTGSLPFIISPGSEVLLTSLFLQINNINNRIELKATIGWEAQLLLLNIVPKLLFRIRRGGTSAPATVVFQTTDSVFLGTVSDGPWVPLDFTTSFQHTEAATAGSVGTFQQYALTVEHIGQNSATITGPVHFDGIVYL